MPDAILSTPVDHQGRVTLPAEFAGTIVTVEPLSDTEVLIRRSEGPALLCSADAEILASLLESPPEPTPALRAAFARYPE